MSIAEQVVVMPVIQTARTEVLILTQEVANKTVQPVVNTVKVGVPGTRFNRVLLSRLSNILLFQPESWSMEVVCV